MKSAKKKKITSQAILCSLYSVLDDKLGEDESERIILFGGSDVNGSSLNETWSLYREFYALPPMTIPIPPIIDYWYGLLIIAGVIAFVIFMVVRRRSYSNR